MTCNLPSISQLGPRSTGQLCKPRGMLLTFASRLHATQMQSDIIPVASSPSTHTHHASAMALKSYFAMLEPTNDLEDRPLIDIQQTKAFALQM